MFSQLQITDIKIRKRYKLYKRAIFMEFYKKGQSAMEYLMTYGWALLVIVVVLASLLFISPFSTPELCILDGGYLSCSEHRLVSFDGKHSNVVYANIVNNERYSIDILGLACARGDNIPKLDDEHNFVNKAFRIDTTGKKIILKPGGKLNTGRMPKGNPFKLQCHDIDNDGRINTRYAFLKGEKFIGKIYIVYKIRGEPESIPPKIIAGRITGNVQ